MRALTHGGHKCLGAHSLSRWARHRCCWVPAGRRPNAIRRRRLLYRRTRSGQFLLNLDSVLAYAQNRRPARSVLRSMTQEMSA